MDFSPASKFDIDQRFNCRPVIANPSLLQAELEFGDIHIRFASREVECRGEVVVIKKTIQAARLASGSLARDGHAR